MVVGMTSFQSAASAGSAAASHAAAELRAEMARQGKRKTDLAGALGVTLATASRRFHGEVALDVTELVDLAEWLGVPVERFYPASGEAATA